jgi:hypothetical protein
MSLQDLGLKKTYSSDEDDILREFYVPSLRVSTGYDRLAGFFSSTSLAISARGIIGLISNGGVFRLLVSPRFSEEDLTAITGGEGQDRLRRAIEDNLLSDIENLEDEFVRDHVSALGWMIAQGRMEIRVIESTKLCKFPS